MAGTPDYCKDFPCGQVEVYPRKELLLACENVQVAYVDVEPDGSLVEQQRPVFHGDFRLVVTGGLVFAEDNLLVALALLVGYRMPELEFSSFFECLELDFVLGAVFVDFSLCGGVTQFYFFDFLVYVEQQKRKFAVFQVGAHLLYANTDDVAVVDFGLGDLHIVQEREAVRGEALDVPFDTGLGLLAFDDGVFPRHEPFGKVEVAPFLSPYGKGLFPARCDDTEHGCLPAEGFYSAFETFTGFG